MPQFVVFAMTESNKDVPTVVLVATEWNRIVRTLRGKIGDLVDTFVKQTLGDLVECRDEDLDAAEELSAKFGWEPNFHWVTRRYVDVPSTHWHLFTPFSVVPFGKLVVYESYDPEQLELFPDSLFEIY
jgi:hypothetical protein